MKNFSKKIKKVVPTALKRATAFTLVFVLVASFIPASALSAYAAGNFPASSNKPIHAATLSAGNDTVGYKDEALSTGKAGTVYASDDCQLLEIFKNSKGVWTVKGKYPVKNGMKTLYFPLSAFTTATSLGDNGTARAGFNVMARPGGPKFGSVSKNDIVYKLVESGDWVQILFNLGSPSPSSITGWKIGWITKSTYLNNVKVTSAATVSYNNPTGSITRVEALTENTFCIEINTYDGDTNTGVDLHYYIDGPAGSGARGYAISNTARTLNKTITIYDLDLTKPTTLYFYAVNAGPGTSNTFLGERTTVLSNLKSPVPDGCKFSKKTNDNGWVGYHDINQKVSTATPVYAIADGTVTYKQAYTTVNGKKYLTSYGNYVEFKSSDGVYTAKFCHLDSFNGVDQKISSADTLKKGGSEGKYTLITKSVKKGDILGYCGTTGNSSGIHLHLELFENGTRVDPTTLFPSLA